MKKAKMFVVTKTPKALDNILSVKADLASKFYCAVVNVSDSPCASFDYQLKVPSFWFPINEIGQWGHSPFYGTMKVVNEYFVGHKPVLIHCHAGANRSPSVAFAVMVAKGYTVEQIEKELEYEDLSLVFQRNLERKHIPSNILDFLKVCEASPELTSLNSVLRKMNALYDSRAEKMFADQSDCSVGVETDNPTRLVYNRETKRFVVVRDKPRTPEDPTSRAALERKYGEIF